MAETRIGKDRLIWVGIALGVAIISFVALYAGALIYFTWPVEVLSLDKSGVLGDSFGALNALFSGIAFAGLIIAILYQREDLILQRNELRLTTSIGIQESLERHFPIWNCYSYTIIAWCRMASVSNP